MQGRRGLDAADAEVDDAVELLVLEALRQRRQPQAAQRGGGDARVHVADALHEVREAPLREVVQVLLGRFAVFTSLLVILMERALLARRMHMYRLCDLRSDLVRPRRKTLEQRASMFHGRLSPRLLHSLGPLARRGVPLVDDAHGLTGSKYNVHCIHIHADVCDHLQYRC